MAVCCLGSNSTFKEFTFLLIHVLHVSHPAALERSIRYARKIVDRFFSEHTRIDVSYFEPHDYKFRNLVVESRLEIAFVRRPKGFRIPNCKIYKYEHSEGLAVVFEVETRLIKRYIPPHCDFDLLKVELTDYLALSGCTRRQVTDTSVIHEYVKCWEARK